MAERLFGKTALLTGATSGMGVDVARQFVAEGARIVFCGRSVAPGEELARSLGDQARFIRADVTSEADIAMLVEKRVSTLGAKSISCSITQLRRHEIRPSQT